MKDTAPFWTEFKKRKIAKISLFIFFLFFLIALYAPFFASSKPLMVFWNHELYFPLFRYLFYSGFYTKPVDLFFNLLMFTFPLTFFLYLMLKRSRKIIISSFVFLQFSLFFLLFSSIIKNPESDPSLKNARIQYIEKQKRYNEDPLLKSTEFKKSWDFELKYMSPYEKLNALLRYLERKKQHNRILPYIKKYEKERNRPSPTLWSMDERNDLQKRKALYTLIDEKKQAYQEAVSTFPALMTAYIPHSHAFIMAKYELMNESHTDLRQFEKNFNEILKEAGDVRLQLISAKSTIETMQKALSDLDYLKDKKEWLEKESQSLRVFFPLLRDFHWEDDAGGAQSLNAYLPWWELSRINRKDLLASLIFGIRVSLIVGISAVSISLLVGILLGTIAGYFAGKTDIFICRVIEIWETMPTFFMLMLIIAITQSKSMFLVISILGIYGWTGICRFIRGEVLRQRNMPYVTAAHSLGFPHRKIMFSHILPNAIPPILTLVPFSLMAAITSEAGLSFLGLGEEGSTSWGVLMDEGRSVFPAESFLLWPPAILLTLLLISIALIGDGLRDAIDPKMRS